MTVIKDKEIILKINEKIAKIEEQNNNQYMIIQDMYGKLFGDGDEGLCRKVERHDEQINEIKENNESLVKNIKWYIGTMIAAITIIVGSFKYLF